MNNKITRKITTNERTYERIQLDNGKKSLTGGEIEHLHTIWAYNKMLLSLSLLL